MTAIQLRAELFREMSPLLDNESAMEKVILFVRGLVQAQKTKAATNAEKPYKVIPVSSDIRKWGGCVSFTEAEIESAPRLKALLSR